MSHRGIHIFTIDAHPSDMEEGFQAFHKANPEVYERLVEKLSAAYAMNRKRIGMGMLFEVLRWDHHLSICGNEQFKLNNNYRAFYTRLITKNHPHLGAIITRRGSVADE